MNRSRLRISASLTGGSEDCCIPGHEDMWPEDEIHPHWWWRLQVLLKTLEQVYETLRVTFQNTHNLNHRRNHIWLLSSVKGSTNARLGHWICLLLQVEQEKGIT